MAVNEQLILSSIGKVNVQQSKQLKGRIRERSQEVPSKSADCVLGVGAVSRCGFEAVNEAFRVLRPGGLFVFVEPQTRRGGESTLALIEQVTPIVPTKLLYLPLHTAIFNRSFRGK